MEKLTIEQLKSMDGEPVWLDNAPHGWKCYIVNNEYEAHGRIEPCGIDLWGAGTSLSLLVQCGLYSNLPADVATVQHGKWERDEEAEKWGFPYICSQCKKAHNYKEKFCPNCGAKMDLQKD